APPGFLRAAEIQKSTFGRRQQFKFVAMLRNDAFFQTAARTNKENRMLGAAREQLLRECQSREQMAAGSAASDDQTHGVKSPEVLVDIYRQMFGVNHTEIVQK